MWNSQPCGFSLPFWEVLPFLPSLWIQGIAFLLSDAVPNFRNLFFAQQLLCYRLLVMTRWTGRLMTCRCGLFLLMVVWWGETYCASNSLELVQPFYANWGKIGTRACCGTIARLLGFRNWVLVLLCFSPTSSPLVPYLILSSLPR